MRNYHLKQLHHRQAFRHTRETAVCLRAGHVKLFTGAATANMTTENSTVCIYSYTEQCIEYIEYIDSPWNRRADIVLQVGHRQARG